ncbi:glycosyltransferase family 39 protein [Streptomyces sp. J2-1]|uniref:ArnT family glycosyltransferase n=1 Tax=Streptomyces corallincola TaxID=2851888 RepID=UPI001C3922EB|nr:glycosyltransferase family 39 protein [Streptomyces corallincola]MBV2356872.1 glycosyltransferase family 39 protein [Streptomyces corallincola]
MTTHPVLPAAEAAPRVRPSAGPAVPRLARRLWRGRTEDPAWARPALLGLLALTLATYLYGLSASGYANSFYAAAVQAGGTSWKAFFFGSLDGGNAITVDKPSAFLWPMELAVRIFGLGSWSVLVPQVLMGVGTVAVVYAGVRRRSSPAAGLIAGAVLALTPVAALMFRFDNPDAMLALLMALACYFTVRAVEDGRTRWLVGAGVAVGLAFLAKTLQAFVILPPLAIVYAVCGPVRPLRRLAQLGWATLALLVSGGWWVAIVELWPADSRPYVGGSQHNSFLELTFGYNGLGRISGDETGSVGGGGGPGGRSGGGGGMWGSTGWDRMFTSEVGGQVSWLLPAALILLVAALWATRKARRASVTRASFLVWGGSLLITMVVFSYMAGIFHSYYTIALAPYLAAVTGMGAGLLWERRRELWAALTLAAAVVAGGAWGYVLLNRTPSYLPWLRWLVLIGALLAAFGLVFAGRLPRRAALAAALVGLLAGLGGPTAYTLSTVNSGHTGSLPTAGPAGAGMRGFGARAGGFRAGGGFGGGGFRFPGGAPGGAQGPGQGSGTGGAPGAPGAPGQGSGGGFPGFPGGTGTGSRGEDPRTGGGVRGGGMGGLLNGAKVSADAKKLLARDAAKYTWVAASIGSQNAASYQLATGRPVMAIGGFNGTDPSPTLAQFKTYVAEGRVHYFIAGGGMGMGRGTGRTGGSAEGAGGMPGAGRASGTSSSISTWVEATFRKVTVGSATFYDLTRKV